MGFSARFSMGQRQTQPEGGIQPRQRLRKGQAVQVLHQPDHISARVAAEAVPASPVPVYL